MKEKAGEPLIFVGYEHILAVDLVFSLLFVRLRRERSAQDRPRNKF